jgi:putative transposase
LGAIFPALARQKECRIIEGNLMPDRVHMGIAIPPKYPVGIPEREECPSLVPV